MRITCPSCAAEYDVPDTLAAGRSVRCARCAEQWTPIPVPPPPPPEPEPEPPAPEPPPPPAPEPAIFARVPLVAPEQPAPAPRRPWPLIAAWAASVTALVVILAALVIFRASVMDAWPPSIRLFAAFGLAS